MTIPTPIVERYVVAVMFLTALVLCIRGMWREIDEQRRCALCRTPGIVPGPGARHWESLYCIACALAILEARAIYRYLAARDKARGKTQ